MWGQIPALCAEKVVAQTSKKRVRAKNLLGNHPGKRAHIHQDLTLFPPSPPLSPFPLSLAPSPEAPQQSAQKSMKKSDNRGERGCGDWGLRAALQRRGRVLERV